MKLRHTNRILMVTLAVVALTSALVRVDHSRPNFEVVLAGDMRYSPAYGAYAANDNFTDGRTLQAPIPGTIARGARPLHYEATPQDALRAGEELASPYDPLSDDGQAATARGAGVYQVFCTPCHGAGGAGDGPVSQRGFPPPPSLLTGKSVQMKDGQLFHVLTYGQGSMPTFAAQLLADRRWDVIYYVRKLQQQAASQAAPPPDTGDAAPAPAEQETPDAPAADADPPPAEASLPESAPQDGEPQP